MEKTFTIEEIRNYISKQDSLGDVLYNLKAENIEKANLEIPAYDSDEFDPSDVTMPDY